MRYDKFIKFKRLRYSKTEKESQRTYCALSRYARMEKGALSI